MTLLIEALNELLTTRFKDNIFLQLAHHTLSQAKQPDNQLKESIIASWASSKIGFPLRSSSPVPIYRDLRLRRILLNGVRKFLAQQDKYYSVPLNKGDKAISSVFIGGNGVGKSSVYSAFEMIGMGFSDTARVRGYISPNEQMDFMRNINSKNTCVIYPEFFTQSQFDKFDLSLIKEGDSEPERILPEPVAHPAFFCMEHDIAIISSTKLNSDHFYIANQLGLGSYVRFLGILREMLKNYNENILNYTALIKAKATNEWDTQCIDVLSQVNASNLQSLFQIVEELKSTNPGNFNDSKHKKRLEKLLEYISPDLLSSILRYPTSPPNKLGAQIVSDIKEHESTFTKSKNYLIRTTINRIYDILLPIFSLPDVDAPYKNLTIAKELFSSNLRKISGNMHVLEARSTLLELNKKKVQEFQAVTTALEEIYSRHINRLCTITSDILNATFGNYLSPDAESISLLYDPTTLGVKVRMKTFGAGRASEARYIEPQKMLNTFRMKLFCVCFKISLALCCRELYHINFPIVMDDIFDSSDFTNREHIRNFIRNLYNVHDLKYKTNYTIQGYEVVAINEQPLQLILFTQDELLADSVARGMIDHAGHANVLYARIFNCNETDDSDYKAENHSALGEIKVANITEAIL